MLQFLLISLIDCLRNILLKYLYHQISIARLRQENEEKNNRFRLFFRCRDVLSSRPILEKHICLLTDYRNNKMKQNPFQTE